MIPHPPNIKATLFPHQLASVYRMEEMEREQLVETNHGYKETRMGVLADQTGFGKTLSMVTLLLRDKMEWDEDHPFTHEIISTESAGFVRNRVLRRFDRLGATLVLVDQSIVKQWQNELAKTELRSVVITSKSGIDHLNTDVSDVVLVTPSMYNTLVMTYAKYAWKRFIYDEPGHMRVTGMKSVTAGFCWFVTATPERICDQHRNCRGSFMRDIIGYHGYWDHTRLFDGMVVRNNEAFVRSSFQMPTTRHHQHQCFEPTYNTIGSFVSPVVLTMIAAGNIAGAVTALGGSQTDNIVELVRNKKLEEVEEIESKIRIYSMRNDEERVREWQTRLETVRHQIKDLDQRFEDRLQGTCSICFDTVSSPVLEPACQNIFCGECLLKWFRERDTCPLCRIRVDKSSLVYIQTGKETPGCNGEHEPNVQPSTKVEKIGQLIEDRPDGKFLVFSEYDETFLPICRLMEERGISFSQIKGHIRTKERVIDTFKNGTTRVIFLNSRYNGAGINLQEATDIILFHEMSSAMETQIVGRANRIGRTIPLDVHHLQVYTTRA